MSPFAEPVDATITTGAPQRASILARAAVSAKTPPPAWLQRIAPNAARQSALQRPPSPAVESAMMIWGGGFAAMMLAAFHGLLGWVAGMLLGFGATGRWPGAATPSGDGVLRL